MVGTLFSLAIAAFLLFNPIPEVSHQHIYLFGVMIALIASLLGLVQTAISIFAWEPLIRLEKNFASRTIQLFSQDRVHRLANWLLIFFLLFSYLIALDLLLFEHLPKNILIAAWSIALGIAVDLLLSFYKRIINRFLNPYKLISLQLKRAHDAIVRSKETELCDWIDAMTETAIKGLKIGSYSLSCEAIEKLHPLTASFLSASKTIAHHEKDEKTEGLGASGEVNYTLFFLFERLNNIFQYALDSHLEIICDAIITTLGKITLEAAKFDITLISFPLHYLGRLALKAQKEGMEEVANRTTLTLIQMSKILISDTDLTYVEIKEPFLSILDYMDKLAKESFRRDKKINISLLIHPFEILQELFSNPRIASHQDTPDILKSIANTIDEYRALQAVMSTIPPIEKAPPAEA